MVNLLTASLRQIMQRIQILYIPALQRVYGLSAKRCNELYIVLYIYTSFDIFFWDNLHFSMESYLQATVKFTLSPLPTVFICFSPSFTYF